jgi:peroxiredoxin
MLPKPGDKVWTIGHPNQLENTISWGNVSAVRRTHELPDEVRAALQLDKRAVWIQTDAVIDHGSSGGPLLNAQGQVIGMNTFMVGAQLGFALHVVHGRAAYEQAKTLQPMALPIPPSKGESALAWASREVGPAVRAFGEEIEKLQMVGLPEPQFVKRAAVIQARYRTKLLKIIRDNPSGWPAFQASYFLCSMMLDESQDSQQCQQEVCDFVLKYHVEKEDVAALMLALIPLANDAARSFCSAVEHATPHREVQSLALASVAQIRLLSLAQHPSADIRELLAARAEVAAIATRFETEFRELDGDQHAGAQLAQVLREKLAMLPIGQPAAEIEGVDADGKSFKLSEYRGKVTVVSFFGDWCPYCKQMYQLQRQLVESNAERPLVLLGVNTDDQDVLRELVQRGTVTWRCWTDGSEGPIAASWEVTLFPCIYLIDHHGIVRRQFTGSPDERVLTETIEALVQEAEQEAATSVAQITSNR